VVLERDVLGGEALGVPDADNDRLGHHAAAGEHGNPFIGGEVDACGLAEGGVEKGVAIVENDEWKAVRRVARVAGRQPDEEFAILRQKPGAHDLAGEPAAEPVLPIRNRVLKRGVEPDLMGTIPRHISEGVHRLAFPRSACDFVFEVRSCGHFDFSGVKGFLPVEAQGARGVPASERLDAA